MCTWGRVAREQSLQPFSEMKSCVAPRDRTTLVLHFFLLLHEPLLSALSSSSSSLALTHHSTRFPFFRVLVRLDCMLSAIFTAMDGRNCFIRNRLRDAISRKNTVSLVVVLPQLFCRNRRDLYSDPARRPSPSKMPFYF